MATKLTSTTLPPAYLPHNKHRNSTPDASQWSISQLEEQTCFSFSFTKGWGSSQTLWGLHFQLLSKTPCALGFDFVQGSRIDVKIAKFTQDQGVWHGYPVAHWRGQSDKPPFNVLNEWCIDGHINESARSRIYRGKKCSL